MTQKHIAVIGAGVVGLSIAHALSQKGHRVTVFEKEAGPAQHTSSHNSGIIHAGLYYKPDSLKAKFCIKGRRMMYEFCAAHNIRTQKVGKLIVTTHESQLEKLQSIFDNAQKTGAAEVQLLDKAQLQELEPDVTGIAAILSPETGIVDVKALIEVLIAQIEASSGEIVYGTQVKSIQRHSNHYSLLTLSTCHPSESWDPENLEANATFNSRSHVRRSPDSANYSAIRAWDDSIHTFDGVINAAGLWAGQVWQSIEGLPHASIPKTYFAKGNYFRLAVPTPFRHLVYPLPMPGGLGIHVSFDFNGTARFGPDVEWLDGLPSIPDYTVDPTRADNFRAAIATYYPSIADMELRPDYAGIRPKLVPAGEPDADFIIQDCAEFGLPNLINLYGFESPGLTGCLAVGEFVADIIEY